MAISGSLQLSPALGLCRDQGCSKQRKTVMSRDRMHLLNAALSSRVSVVQQESWNTLVSNHLHRRICSVPCRSIAIRCHSFSGAGKAFELPAIKAASLALTKSYNVLQGCPLVVKLAPAVVLVVFSVWGLVPLVRRFRNLLLNRSSDNNWKKSSTYYVMTSYVQPLLLWTGALFICRALDPIVLPTEASRVVKDRLLNFVRSLSTVLAFAYCLSSVIQQTQKFFTETSDPTDARNMGFQFAGKAVYSAVWVAAASLFMELLGFSTQRWLTAGGLGTVLLTLAGREIFTNFLSSVMIHATRPFIANEWIQTKIEGYEVSGTVEHVGWWSPTIVRGEDREAVHIPNHKFTVNVVRNLSQKTHWRIKTHLAISHLDVNKINNIVADMRKVLAKNPQVEQQRLHRRVFLENINPENQALLILISCFVKTSHYEEYLCVKESILLDLLRVISHHRARLATPIRTIRKMYNDSDMDNIPFADSFYDRGGVASKRPLLLIEPSYRINGEDKSKPQSRSSRPNAEQENKTPSPKSKETPALDPKPNAKIGETSNSGAKESSGSSPVSDPRVAEEAGVKPTSKPIPKTNLKDIEPAGSSGMTKSKSVSSAKQMKIENPRNDGHSETERTDGLQSSQPSVSRTALEENIVLGVALEGPKRTLPIEEEMGASPAPAEGKGLAAARRSGNGPLRADKDNKDGHAQASPNTSSEQ